MNLSSDHGYLSPPLLSDSKRALDSLSLTSPAHSLVSGNKYLWSWTEQKSGTFHSIKDGTVTTQTHLCPRTPAPPSLRLSWVRRPRVPWVPAPLTFSRTAFDYPSLVFICSLFLDHSALHVNMLGTLLLWKTFKKNHPSTALPSLAISWSLSFSSQPNLCKVMYSVSAPHFSNHCKGLLLKLPFSRMASCRVTNDQWFC